MGLRKIITGPKGPSHQIRSANKLYGWIGLSWDMPAGLQILKNNYPWISMGLEVLKQQTVTAYQFTFSLAAFKFSLFISLPIRICFALSLFVFLVSYGWIFAPSGCQWWRKKLSVIGEQRRTYHTLVERVENVPNFTWSYCCPIYHGTRLLKEEELVSVGDLPLSVLTVISSKEDDWHVCDRVERPITGKKCFNPLTKKAEKCSDWAKNFTTDSS